MTAFLLFCATILAVLGHGYFWVAIVNRLHGLAGPRKFIDGGTNACAVGFVLLPLYLVWKAPYVAANWDASWYQEVGFATRYFQFCVIFCLGEALVKFLFAPRRNRPADLLEHHVQRVEAPETADRSVYRGPFAQRLASFPGNHAHELQIEKKRIAVPRLHASHAGLRIAHLSDFHLAGRMDCRWYEMVVDQVSGLEPDVIVITGDIVESTECVPWLEQTLCRLQAPLGVYFILGNHDKYIDVSRTREILSAAGHTCVSGKWLEAYWNGAPVVLAGNERPWLPEIGDIEQAPRRDSDNLPLRLFLLHSPDQIGWAQQHDANLVLAGHTHGGQICFPFLGAVACPSLYGTRFTDGVYRVGETLMHVTRGLGGRTPLRTLCRPEIALLELAQPTATR